MMTDEAYKAWHAQQEKWNSRIKYASIFLWGVVVGILISRAV